jgi:hypothetical protein
MNSGAFASSRQFRSTSALAPVHHRESEMVKGYEAEGSDRKIRTIMSVAAVLCVLGLASLVWLHDGQEAAAAATSASLVASDVQPPAGDSLRESATGVPSAESVFRGAAYVAPEEPIAQF